jgi:hypothetical protein
VVREILSRIKDAGKDEQADALAQLLVLSKLRGARSLIERKWQAMGVTVSVEDIALLREPIDRARAAGEAEGEARGQARGQALSIERILQQRFPGRLPAGLADRLANLGPEVLDEILRRSVTATSVEDALGGHMPAKVPGAKD